MTHIIIKSLGWTETQPGTRWHAMVPKLSPSTPSAFYEIDKHTGGFSLTVAMFDRIGHRYENIWLAKAAADEHYSAYVRSLLVDGVTLVLPE